MGLKRRYHIVLVVWGDEFTRLFVDLVLPTNLSPGNLPALSERADVSYHIHTTPSSEAMIRTSMSFPLLDAAADVVFHTIGEDLVQGRNKYALLTTCHRHSMEIARERDEALIFLGPDGLFADGCLLRLHELALEGFRAVMIAGLRAWKRGFVEGLRDEFDVGAEPSINLSRRKLVELLASNLHPVEQALCWREESLASWPSHLLWRVGEVGLVARCYHLHPLMIRPESWTWEGGELDTVDGSLVSQAVANPNEIYIVTDSDELVACELSDEIEGDVYRATPNQDSGTKRVAAWMRRSTDPCQRDFAGHKIRFHTGLSGTAHSRAWSAVESKSDAVIERIAADYARLEPPPG